MTNKLIPILAFISAVLLMVITFPDGFAASALLVSVGGLVIIIIRREYGEDSEYLIRLFFIALIVRVLFGIIIHVYDLRSFFGGDADTYDVLGQRLYEIWFENNTLNDVAREKALATSGSGWGMSKLVFVIYLFTGRNILAAQTFCATIGAATVPMIYSCATKIFKNRQVGQISALLVALSPAFITWTGQLLKDGLIIFLLVLSMTLVLRLQERFSYWDIVYLILSLFAIFTLRFYIFFMAGLAIVGSLMIGTSLSLNSIIRRGIILLLLGGILTYVGVIENANEEFEKYGDLGKIQNSRLDLARSAESGYGEDVDVSTTGGAISAIPIGFLYLMLAPFPWEMSNFRQFITLPEVLMWWASIPFLIKGLIFTLKKRLRVSIPIIVFALLLILAYSVFLGNVGTAYRQRTQIQVFLFIFIAVGWTLSKEEKENKLLEMKAKNREVERKIRKNTELKA